MVSNYRISIRLQRTSINPESDHYQLTSELHYSIHKNLILISSMESNKKIMKIFNINPILNARLKE